MILVDRFRLLAYPILVAAVLAGCGGGETEAPPATAEAGNEPASEPSPAACPPEGDIVAIVGHPVQAKPGGALCFYETDDFAASVTIMRITPGQADQVLQEMRDSAAPYGSEVVAIDLGDSGHAWGSPGYGQGYAIAGDRGWLLDVSISMGEGEEASQRDAVVELLERVIG
ncbi:MAG TPA: hypothetical protein VMR66_06525 [Gemmatimonadota bacterium]|nr:hypothetical protein [Gemmatimonadota bacterium]